MPSVAEGLEAAAGARTEVDGPDAAQGADRDDVPEAQRNEISGEEIYLVTTVGAFATASAASDGEMEDA